MGKLTLIESRIRAGVWKGLVRGDAADMPMLELVHEDKVLGGMTIGAAEAGGDWIVAVPIPAEALCDGIQSFLLREAAGGAVLGRFAIKTGEVLAGSVEAEIALLRAELDMLKRAFRRHCQESDPRAAP